MTSDVGIFSLPILEPLGIHKMIGIQVMQLDHRQFTSDISPEKYKGRGRNMLRIQAEIISQI